MEWHCPVCGRTARYDRHESCFASDTNTRAPRQMTRAFVSTNAHLPTELVERVAQAINDANDDAPYPWESAPRSYRQCARKQARAAIAVMANNDLPTGNDGGRP